MGKSNQSAGTQTVTNNSTTGPPQWAQNAGLDLYTNSRSVADNLKPTAVAAPAGLTDGQQSLFGQLMGNVGGGTPSYNQALSTLGGLQGYSPTNVNAGTLASTDLKPYEDPYTQDVINTSLATGDQARKQAINETGASAIGSNAFGGSRQGVQEGVTNSQYGLQAANLAANLNSQNFNQARGAASQDITNKLAADTGNQQAGLAGAGLNLNAATGAAGVAGQQQQTYLQSLFAALTGQNAIQGQAQAQNQYAADTANAQNNLGAQRLAVQRDTLAGIPLAQSTSGTQTGVTEKPGSSLMQTLGGGLGVAGALAALGGPVGFGLWGAGTAAAGAAAGAAGKALS